MQQLNPSRGAYTDAQILDALLARKGTQTWGFRYERLDFQNKLIADITGMVESCTISYSYLADIKRTATLTMDETASFNYLKDHLKPWVRLRMPDGGWVEWPQGVFLLSSPTRTDSDGTSNISRAIDAYDQLQVFNDDGYEVRHSLAAGTKYTDNIKALLNSTAMGTIAMNLVPSSATLSVIKEYEPGTTKLAILNDLLGAINYDSLWFDENGVAIARPYQTPDVRSPEFDYVDDSTSVIVPGVNQTLDLFNIPNSWRYTVSDPDKPGLTSAYDNTSLTSITSIPNRGRTIRVLNTEAVAANQTALDAIVKQAAFDASQVYETIDWNSGLMPIHSNGDVYNLAYSTLGITDKYSETAWSLPLDASASMTHSARKIVSV